jgi:hypothetical protein
MSTGPPAAGVASPCTRSPYLRHRGPRQVLLARAPAHAAAPALEVHDPPAQAEVIPMPCVPADPSRSGRGLLAVLLGLGAAGRLAIEWAPRRAADRRAPHGPRQHSGRGRRCPVHRAAAQRAARRHGHPPRCPRRHSLRQQLRARQAGHVPADRRDLRLAGGGPADGRGARRRGSGSPGSWPTATAPANPTGCWSSTSSLGARASPRSFRAVHACPSRVRRPRSARAEGRGILGQVASHSLSR